MARLVVPGLPHHVTQRGNRRQQTFFTDDDYRLYIELMSQWCQEHRVEIWAYCLMPNHVHMIATPSTAEGLRQAFGEAHRRYTLHVNSREGWQGCLWQGRFRSFAMDNRHLLSAARYIELNPVRAGLVDRAEEYRWSSAAAHIVSRDDRLVAVRPLLQEVGDWHQFLGVQVDTQGDMRIRRHEKTGRPLGGAQFIAHLEEASGRVLRPRTRGPKRKPARFMVSPN